MRTLRVWFVRIGSLFGKERRERELAAEMESHLALHIEENLRSGLTLRHARRAALLKLGGVEQTKELYRDRRGLPFLETLFLDLRFGARMLRKNPGFSALVIATLAIGIGANAAIFSLVNAVLLSPMDYKDPGRLVMVWRSNAAKSEQVAPVSGGDFAEWKSGNSVFEQMAPSWDTICTLTGQGEPQMVVGYQLSVAYFEVLGARPQLGRTFLPDEDRPGGPNVVVLSDKLWRRVFHADRQIIGKIITLDAAPYTVVGVMGSGFRYPSLTELWIPLGMNPAQLTNYKSTPLRILARLRPGVSARDAEKQLNAIEARVVEQHPDTDKGNSVKVVPLREEMAGDIRLPLLVLLGAVAFLLLIGCTNVANLMLARTVARKKEIAVRLALGASRVRLIRAFLTESILLSTLGGVGGLGIAALATGFLVRIFPNNIANLNIPVITEIPIDGRVLLFTLLLSVLTSVLFGIAPLLYFSQRNAGDEMKDAGRGSTSRPRERRFGYVLVVAEIALSLMLLVGAGLFLESFRNLMKVNFGVDTDRVIAAELFLSNDRYPRSAPEHWNRFAEDVIDRVRQNPQVDSAGATNFLPLSGFWSQTAFTVAGKPQPVSGQEPTADFRLATVNYFQTMGMRVIEGRGFTERDAKDATPVAVINQTLARKVWDDESPVGQRINLGDANKPTWCEVVGVVSNVNSFGLEEKPHSDIFRPFAQDPYALISFVVRTRSNPETLASALQQAIWSIDKDQPIYKTISMEQLADDSVALRRVSSILLGFFSAIALLLAALGIYGVMAYMVTRRQNEIGVRMALGARPESILRMVTAEGMRLAAFGLAIGLAGALAFSRVIASLLYGVNATNAFTFVAMTAILAAVAFAACWIPARRASRLDPMVALRDE